MKLPSSYNLLLLPLIFLSACVTNKPLTSIDRTKYPTVAVSPQVECPDKYSYLDLTAQRARGNGAGFGLAGMLVGEAVASSSISAGRKIMDPVVEKTPIDIRAGIFRSFTTTLDSAKFFRLAGPGAPKDAVFQLKVLNFGLQPANDRQLGGVVVLQANLLDKTNKSLWSKTSTGVSGVAAFLDDYAKNPALYKQAIEEAMVDVTRKVILYAH